MFEESVNTENDSTELSDRQRALYETLRKKAPDLANMYLGTLRVLGQKNNPERIVQAAHSIRELMEKIPAFVDVQTRAISESLRSKVRELEDIWNDTLKKTECHNDTNWNGDIDKPLRNLLKRLHSFFDWFRKHRPRRKEEIASTLRKMDNSGRELPAPLEQLNVRTWDELRTFFLKTAHHSKPACKQKEFNQWLDALENFLLDRLIPRTFEDFEKIDAIICEGESDA